MIKVNYFLRTYEWTLHCDMKLCTCTMTFALHYYLISKLWNNWLLFAVIILFNFRYTVYSELCSTHHCCLTSHHELPITNADIFYSSWFTSFFLFQHNISSNKCMSLISKKLLRNMGKYHFQHKLNFSHGIHIKFAMHMNVIL